MINKFNSIEAENEMRDLARVASNEVAEFGAAVCSEVKEVFRCFAALPEVEEKHTCVECGRECDDTICFSCNHKNVCLDINAD